MWYVTIKKSLPYIQSLTLLFAACGILSACSFSLNRNFDTSLLSFAPSITRMDVSNNQVTIQGSNFDQVQSLSINDQGTSNPLTISSKTSGQIVALATSALNLIVNKSYNLILSNAYASSSFPITFSLTGITVDSLGNVGIGTTTPTSRLSVDSGSSQEALSLNSTSGQTYLRLDGSGTTMGTIRADSFGNLVLSPTGSSNLYLSFDGGSGTTYFGGTPYLRPANNNTDLTLSSTGTGRVILNGTGGNVGIGTTNPTQSLQVGSSGDGSSAIANAWNIFSDIRLKTDLKRISNACEMVDQLNGYYYYWKDGQDRSRQVGVVAQEVEKVLPELVKTGSDGIKTVDYAKLTAILIEASKQQNRDIASMKAEYAHIRTENAQLKQENAEIKARVERIEKSLQSN